MSSTWSSRDFQDHSGYFLYQTWDSGSDYSPRQSRMCDFRRLESDPRTGVLDLGYSVSILA